MGDYGAEDVLQRNMTGWYLWIAIGMVAAVVIGALVAERRPSGGGRGSVGESRGGVLLGAMVSVVHTKETHVEWTGIADRGVNATIASSEGDEEDWAVPSLDMQIVEWGVRQDGRLDSVTTRVTTDTGAMVVGVAQRKIGNGHGLEILSFGGVTVDASMRAGDVSVWRSTRDGEETELVLGRQKCGDSRVNVVQQYDGHLAGEWMGRRPEELRDWAVADDFRVIVRYEVKYGQLAPRIAGSDSLGTIVRFDRDSANIREDEARKLRNEVTSLRALLEANPWSSVIVEGHADDRGAPDFNQRLGMKRARSVVRFLARERFDTRRWAVVSCGEGMPRIPREDEAARMQNRRVELRIAMSGRLGW